MYETEKVKHYQATRTSFHRIKKNNMQSNAIKKVKNINTTKIQIDKKLVLSYFLTELYYPLCFYIVYIYMGELMKKYLHMTGEEVINHNLILKTVSLTYQYY